MRVKSIVKPTREVSLPRLGKIRLGIKKKNPKGKEYPVETDYFVVPSEVEAVYGPEPKELPIMFPSDKMETIFPQAYNAFGQNHLLKCEGTGQVAWRKEGDRDWVERDCPCEWLDQKKCSFVARLMFWLPAVDLGGVYQIDTGSKTSVSDIEDGLAYILKAAGRFAFIPCTLKREPTIIGHNGKANTHYTMKLYIAVGGLQELDNFRRDPLQITHYNVAEPEVVDPKGDPGAVIVHDHIADEENEPLDSPPPKGRPQQDWREGQDPIPTHPSWKYPHTTLRAPALRRAILEEVEGDKRKAVQMLKELTAQTGPECSQIHHMNAEQLDATWALWQEQHPPPATTEPASDLLPETREHLEALIEELGIPGERLETELVPLDSVSEAGAEAYEQSLRDMVEEPNKEKADG